MTQRAQYSSTIAEFSGGDDDAILGGIVDKVPNAAVRQEQLRAWKQQIPVLKTALATYPERGKIYFEYSIPRLGGRIDALVLINHVIFVVEFKVGAKKFEPKDQRQVCDYALDLKNFHETSHAPMIAPVLVATAAKARDIVIAEMPHRDNLLKPINANPATLANAIQKVLAHKSGKPIIPAEWEKGGYHPTPTIIEAATALYRGHTVDEISRSDAGGDNLKKTSAKVAEIIRDAKANSHKSVCFITGVPGAGKTLVGLNIANRNNAEGMSSIFLSGNAPLVNVLRESLARDKIRQSKLKKEPCPTKKALLSRDSPHSLIRAFIGNVHHFRDDCMKTKSPPHEKIALFDEAQRAWDLKTTENFMHRRKGIKNFGMSEPEFLISCLDRHSDWAVIVCLVGGGQEIKSGEAGIGGWIDALVKRFPHWRVCISPHLRDDEYAAGNALSDLEKGGINVTYADELHLSSSMRSFRAERVSELVKQVLDLDSANAHQTLNDIEQYPIRLTRDLRKAKEWLREQAQNTTERYGLIVSSHAERLRPHAIDVRPRINPVHWFLNDADDIRSSYYLEDVVTEFEVQGLEIDWACVTWDADMFRTSEGWEHRRFQGKRWNCIRQKSGRGYQKNAYRVLLTRARQGMVIVVPEGDDNDPTRARKFYDPTFNYLKEIGFEVID